MRTLAIIPARGGSKGVPRKNIRLVGGKPLIAWSILAARACPLVTDCFVSTEDAEIAAVSREWGARVLSRPDDLAGDVAAMDGVVRHALAEAETRGACEYDIFLLLQPTAPMRTGDDISEALGLFGNPETASVVSVYKVEDHHPQRMYLRDAQGMLVPLLGEATTVRRQDLPAVYHRNGAIYACRAHLARQTGRLLHDPLAPYVMPSGRSVNIDNEQDILLADILLSGGNP